MNLEDLLIQAQDPKENLKVKENQTTQKTQSSVKQTKQQIRKIGNVDSELTDELFLKILEKVYKQNQENSMQYNKTYLSPTDLCQSCPRKIFFRMTNANYELQLFYPFSELITHVGNAVHSWVQKHLAKVFKDVQSEIKFELPDLKLKGFIDLVYKTNQDKTIILEIKTIGDEIHDPNFYGKIPHWKQLACYYWIWTEKLGKKCDKVQLMYLKRDFKPIKLANGNKDLPFKIFTVDQPQKLWNTYKDHIMWMYETIIKALQTQTVPTIPNHIREIVKKEECGFCPYQKECSKYPFTTEKQITQSIEFLF